MMRIANKGLLSGSALATAITALIASTACGATYYVAQNGNDSAGGTNLTAPWRTIGKAANTVVAGDVVRVQAGTYTERPNETTDGTSARPITYVCDGFVQIRGGWLISGDYVKIIGFDLTHSNSPNGYNYECVRVENATGVQILDCNIHHTDLESVTFRNTPSAVIRGCKMSHAAWPAYPFSVGDGNALVWVSGNLSTNLLFEYNHCSHSADYYTGGSGIARDVVIRNNRFGPTATSSGAHLDNIQPNAAWVDVLFEANWDEGNDCSDHHMGYWEVEGQLRNVVRGNVMLSNGYLGWSGLDYGGFYHNTFHSNNTYSAGNDVSLYCHNQGGASISNEAYNNIFNYCTKAISTPIQVQSGSACVYDYNLSSGQRPMSVGTHNLTSSPLFSDPGPVRNLTLQVNSPARNSGGPIARASGSGSFSTALSVNNAWMFWPGDAITVGGTPATIASIGSRTSMTLQSAISWTDGAAILWRGQTDLGAFPYQSQGYDYAVRILSPTGSVAAGSVTIAADVTNPNVVRMVEFRVDGVPLAIDNTAPFSAVWNANGVVGTHALEARAYYNFATRTNVFPADKVFVSVNSDGSIAPPRGLRVVTQ